VTIRRGEPWGVAGLVPDDVVVVASDAELHDEVVARRRVGMPLPTFGLLGGDLCRTVGGVGDPDRLRPGCDATLLTVDLGAVLLDGRLHWFTSHLVARRGWWHGSIIAVMNAQFLGRWDVAPRSHPNDGRLDIVEVDGRFGVRQRLQARRLLPTGRHVPHPDVRERRITSETIEMDRPLEVTADGRSLGSARVLVIRCEPDQLSVAV
jgi:YegS C-terminal NAD kinase beta sandwich-like domain